MRCGDPSHKRVPHSNYFQNLVSSDVIEYELHQSGDVAVDRLFMHPV